jgi:hypothetical protein
LINSDRIAAREIAVTAMKDVTTMMIVMFGLGTAHMASTAASHSS